MVCILIIAMCSIIVRVAEKHRECELWFRAGVSCQCRFLCYVSRARVADQGGLDQTLDCWTVDTAKALFWKKAPVDQTWPSTRESSVNFGPGVFGFLARGAKFAESETSFWSKSDKNTLPLIIFSNSPFLSNILFLFMKHQDICTGV